MNKKELINQIVESQKETLDKEIDKEFQELNDKIGKRLEKADIDDKTLSLIRVYSLKLQDFAYKKGLEDGLKINSILNK